MYVWQSTAVNSLECYLGEHILGVVSTAPHKAFGKWYPGLYGGIARKTFGCKRFICVERYLFFPSIVSRGTLGSGMARLQTMPDALCWQRETHTHKYFCFYWSPWSQYQHANRDLLEPKHWLLSCLSHQSDVKTERMLYNKAMFKGIPVHLSILYNDPLLMLIKAPLSSQCVMYTVPAMIESKCWFSIKQISF